MIPFLLMAALACAPHRSTVFGTPIASASVRVLEVPRHTGSCQEALAFSPGHPAPFVGVDGHPTCEGVVIPDWMAAELLDDRHQREFWEAQYQIMLNGRLDDRHECEMEIQFQRQYSKLNLPLVLGISVTSFALGVAGGVWVAR